MNQNGSQNGLIKIILSQGKKEKNSYCDLKREKDDVLWLIILQWL